MHIIDYIENLEPTKGLFLEKHTEAALEKNKLRLSNRVLGIAGESVQVQEDVEMEDADLSVHPFHNELPFADGFPDEITTSTPSRRARSQLLKLLHCLPVLHGIVTRSSASSISNLYAAVEIQPPEWVKTHITPLRDIFTPLELNTVISMCRRNQNVIVMGKDLVPMANRLFRPWRYYGKPNHQTRFHVWMVIVDNGYRKSQVRHFWGPMSLEGIPGEWNPGPAVFPDSPTRSLKWNTDVAVHAEWFNNWFPPTPPLTHSLSLPQEVTTTGLMWDYHPQDGLPSLQFIDIRNARGQIQARSFENCGPLPEMANLFGRCEHWLVVRLGESGTRLGEGGYTFDGNAVLAPMVRINGNDAEDYLLHCLSVILPLAPTGLALGSGRWGIYISPDMFF
ncbi:hypothetical protein FQN54_005342 [Arachnomyces sp. PD_36]|nr:hypothetical protein FQN54_005342 [Arachnomyces sp. PD_36]